MIYSKRVVSSGCVVWLTEWCFFMFSLNSSALDEVWWFITKQQIKNQSVYYDPIKSNIWHTWSQHKDLRAGLMWSTFQFYFPVVIRTAFLYNILVSHNLMENVISCLSCTVIISGCNAASLGDDRLLVSDFWQIIIKNPDKNYIVIHYSGMFILCIRNLSH